MIKSSLFNYDLPKSSINQIPYQNPLDSKLLIADSKKIIHFNDFAKHVENGSGGNAEARVKFWTNVQGQHTDQIYLHIGHMENGVFNLAGADR